MPMHSNRPARRRSASATCCGRFAGIACAPPGRSTTWQDGAPRCRRGPATCRSSKPFRRSTAWRCAGATRPVSTSSCGITRSTSPTRRSPRRSAAGHPIRCSKRDRCACCPVRGPPPCSPSSTRRPPRSANSVTTLRRCAPRSPATISCVWRCRATPLKSPCSATRGGQVSASSRRPTPTPSIAKSSSCQGAKTPGPTWSGCSTGTSTIMPI